MPPGTQYGALPEDSVIILRRDRPASFYPHSCRRQRAIVRNRSAFASAGVRNDKSVDRKRKKRDE